MSGDTGPSRREVIAGVLRPVLAEGETFLVHRVGDEVLVTEPNIPGLPVASELRSRNPPLYGRLLVLNAEIARHTGCGLLLVLFLGNLIFCIGLAAHWWDGWLDPKAARALGDYWVGLLLAFTFGLLLLGPLVSRLLQGAAYRRIRPGLLETLHLEDLDPLRLLALIQGDPFLSKISEYLKRDPKALGGDR